MLYMWVLHFMLLKKAVPFSPHFHKYLVIFKIKFKKPKAKIAYYFPYSMPVWFPAKAGIAMCKTAGGKVYQRIIQSILFYF